MNGRVVILAEEASMTVFLRTVLPAAFPGRSENTDWVLIAHRGRSDLERAVPRKLLSWREPNVRFMITRDNDGAQCEEIKARLNGLVPEGVGHPFCVRIVCQELESWLLGDAEAIAAAYPAAARHPSFRHWTTRDPDELTNAADLLHQLTGTRGKRSRTAAIAQCMVPDRNRSHSFRAFIEGMRRLLPETPS
jgi:hypothetical protein